MTDQPTEKTVYTSQGRLAPSSRELIQGQLTLGKLVFLGGISVVLSLFGPLSLLAPVPLSMAFLLYGPRRAGMLGVGLAALLWGLSLGLNAGLELLPLTGVFSLSVVYAFLVYSFIVAKEHPVTGLLKSGGKLIAFWCVLGLGAWVLSGFNLHGTVTEALAERIELFKTDPKYAPQYESLRNTTTPQAKMLLDTLDRPEALVSSMLKWLPGAVVVGTFFSLWVTLFVILRNSLIWRQLLRYPYGFSELMRFRVPDVFVYAVIAGFALLLGSEYIHFPLGEVLGGNLLLSLAVFYFFQGFGITMDGLAALRIGGLWRSLMLLVIMFFAWRMVVLAGLFDTWINFRRFFKKN
jgi:hypothetical protein